MNFDINPDIPIPKITNDIKVQYSSNEINTNWLLNKILGTKDKQITKISQDEIISFLNILYSSKLQMYDGTNSLEWLKNRIKKRYEQSQSQRGEFWEKISRQYQYILEQIDMVLINHYNKKNNEN